MKSDRLLAVGICIASMTLTQAFGQTAPKPAVPVPPPSAAPTPDRTTASFADWVLRCDRRTDTTPPQRFCELGQAIVRQGDASPQAQIALGRVKANEPVLFTVLVPTSITVEKAPRLTADKVSFDLGWVRCLPSGCIANGVVSDDVLGKLRGQKEPGRLEYRDGVGREIVLPLSFRGIGEALNAFLTESSKQGG